MPNMVIDRDVTASAENESIISMGDDRIINRSWVNSEGMAQLQAMPIPNLMVSQERLLQLQL
jgi:hypothetical protein